MGNIPAYLDPIILLSYLVCLVFVLYLIYLYWTKTEDSGKELTNEVKLKRRILATVGIGGTAIFVLLFLFIVGVMVIGVIKN